MRPTRVLAALGTLAVLAACAPTPTTAPTTPGVSPTPWYFCTPDGASSGAPCSKEEYEAQVARDELYDEAERVYRAFMSAEKEILKKGEQPDDGVLRYTVGEARDLVLQAHAERPRLIEGGYQIRWVRRSPEIARDEDAVAMTACIDNTSAVLETPGSPPASGTITLERIHFVQHDGELRISTFASKQVESC